MFFLCCNFSFPVIILCFFAFCGRVRPSFCLSSHIASLLQKNNMSVQTHVHSLVACSCLIVFIYHFSGTDQIASHSLDWLSTTLLSSGGPRAFGLTTMLNSTSTVKPTSEPQHPLGNSLLKVLDSDGSTHLPLMKLHFCVRFVLITSEHMVNRAGFAEKKRDEERDGGC